MIAAVEASITVARRFILDRVSLAVAPGELVIVLGPNGAGKSTLLGALAGDRALASGEVRLDGRPLSAWSGHERAQRRAVVEQKSTLNAAFRAREVVMLGRADEDIARRALAEVGLDHAADRLYPALSGGEQQRVQIARALTQIWGTTPSALLLDEPVSALDVSVQHAVMALARRRARAGCAVLMTLHDLNLAAQYADRVALLSAGRMIAIGAPAAVLTPATIGAVFGFEVSVLRDPARDFGWIVPRA